MDEEKITTDDEPKQDDENPVSTNPEDLEIPDEKPSDLEEDSEKVKEELEEDLKTFKEFSHKNVIINHFKGSINAPFTSSGNVSIGADDFQLFEVQSEELTRINAVYEADVSYDHMTQLLQQHHALYIHHSQHIGKYTTGLALLHNLVQNIYQIYPSITTKELIDVSFNQDTGYIIDNFDTGSMNQLDEFSLKIILQKLKETNSYLIITQNTGQISNNSLEHLAVFAQGPRDMIKVVENHIFLQDLLPKQLLKMTEILELDEFKEFLATSNIRVRDVETVTEKLSAVINGEATFDDVFHSFKQNVQKRIQDWFQHQDDFNLITFKIALAVFNEQSYELVSEAAKHLRSHLIGDGSNSLLSPFKYNKEKLLAEIQAEEFEAAINTHHGITKTRHIKFKNPDNVEAVLYHVWNNYPDEHQAIFNWIKEVADGDSLSVNERLAEAVAYMCQSEADFYFLRGELIEPWAKSDNLNYRLTAGLILSYLSFYKEHIAQIGKLVHSWAKNKNFNLKWTAAVAYGSPIGINLLHQALLDLKDIYTYNDKRFIRDVTYNSLEFLFQYGNEEDIYFKNLIYLNEWWIEHKKNEFDVLDSLHIFVSFMESLDSKMITNISKNKELIRCSITKLTEQAIIRGKTRKRMLNVLEKWFRLVDEEPEIKGYIEYFFLVLLVESDLPIEEYLISIFDRVITSSKQKHAIAIAKNILN
ncbi:hypothetical protein GH741_00605 [Aquibacillus halophilus]|uniref:Uncharacterized protein n=1 Tax=Aquibacillus halophilus TaxID=930132 RepID=A0A6A8D620_9BACI|nr:hypothetical protein [Aquibacillus halophilus]MRH41173.1 hypothetical protein [Aquibacillus halophilus]